MSAMGKSGRSTFTSFVIHSAKCITRNGKTYYKTAGNQTLAFDKSVVKRIILLKSYDKYRSNLQFARVADAVMTDDLAKVIMVKRQSTTGIIRFVYCVTVDL